MLLDPPRQTCYFVTHVVRELQDLYNRQAEQAVHLFSGKSCDV